MKPDIKVVQSHNFDCKSGVSSPRREDVRDNLFPPVAALVQPGCRNGGHFDASSVAKSIAKLAKHLGHQDTDQIAQQIAHPVYISWITGKKAFPIG